MTSFYAHRLDQIEAELNACREFLSIFENFSLIGLNLLSNQEEEKLKIEQDIAILLKSQEMWTIIASNYPTREEKQEFSSDSIAPVNKDTAKSFYKVRLKQIETELVACQDFQKVLVKMKTKELLTAAQELEFDALEEDIQSLLSNQIHWKRFAERDKAPISTQDTHIVFSRDTVDEKEDIPRLDATLSQNNLTQTSSFASFRSRGSEMVTSWNPKSCLILTFAIILVSGTIIWISITAIY
jgi:hypothetical protein